jgi:hypothetical protein
MTGRRNYVELTRRPPENWRPSCICNSQALDPNEYCTVHGGVFDPNCAWCGQFVSYTHPCKRCGNTSHLQGVLL